MIELEDVTVSYGDTPVIDGASLTVDDGEFVALVGPNGAGKTTLLRTVNGLVEPAAGHVRITGEDVLSLSAREVGRLVATVPQDTSIAFDFTVQELVEMGRTPHRARFGGPTAADQRAIESAMKRTETAQFADRPVGAISGGERSRALLARALAQETPALLLDEPTASLDINHQLRTLSLVTEVEKTTLAAIHDLELAARFADRMALLSDGTIVATGPPVDVLTAERLQQAFDIDVAVGTDPTTGTPSVTALEK